MKKTYKYVLSIIFVLLLVVGITYAVWSYNTQKTNIVMTLDGDQISYDAGADMTYSNIKPVYTMEEGISKEIEVYATTNNYDAGFALYLDLTTWPTTLSNQSFRWALYKNNNYLTSGSFKNEKQGSTINLTKSIQKLKSSPEKDTYKLYLWIDAYQESPASMMNQTFTVSLYGKVTFYEESEAIANDTTPNAPSLADGMIPIKYDYLTSNWLKADSTNTNNDWYDYTNKMWANVVMVKEDKRAEYTNASVGTTIVEDDVLAYYAWIPRYKYILFNTESNTTAQEIQIEFQTTTDTIESGTTNGEYLTHPAFWWDENSDGVRDAGEELAGIWVGKFETGGTTTNPVIKPNTYAITNVNVSGLFNVNKKFADTKYLDGSTSIDSHMMKNMEWGAAAYLSHSKYGINTEICINNSSIYVTGRSGGAVGGSVAQQKVQYSGISTSTAQDINGGYYSYNDSYIDYYGNITASKETGMGQCASTTGNVYGIYDMSGGAFEYVMGVMKTSSGTIGYQSSGFNDSTMPESKYYDLYEYGSSSSDYSRMKLGDATGEVAVWYSDYRTFVSSHYWFIRGGYHSDGASAGAFYFDDYYGGAVSGDGARCVVVLRL